MSIQYDALATSYDLVWQVPAVRPLLPLLTATIKAECLTNEGSVLDLACGTGIGLRILKSLGASRLVGVDISPQMLEIAKATVPGITTHVADCSKPLDHLGLEPASFDVVLGFWLLNYCPSSTEMDGMWANITRYLKPGGKFVGIIENHDVALPVSVETPKYGGTMSEVKELDNGQGWSVHVAFETDPRIEFDAFRLKRDVLEKSATIAGFGAIEYREPTWENIEQAISDGIDQEDKAWWTELIDIPPNYVIVSQKTTG
ncbi:S-adenosyl-L-methionine-dependent methyltransferase [Thelonectria olida]|uniref:S-adenosyl-L-methionine-dependent methyltransferase n=1 Tax=Thelonectria olida TaxID=1576542 RepID=A0A9P8VPL8_9HYPO|nr:S-adenosyl-L-methionine-dependent methyltransferase [Thelonectria olida]